MTLSPNLVNEIMERPAVANSAIPNLSKLRINN